jgi:uncharacterized membrane protein (DUF485 family)
MGVGLQGVIFLCVIAFSIHRSKKRLNTVLYAAGAMALLFGLVLTIAQVLPALNTNLVGAVSFDAMFGVGILVALIHSQKNRA